VRGKWFVLRKAGTWLLGLLQRGSPSTRSKANTVQEITIETERLAPALTKAWERIRIGEAMGLG
jgi:hypothetical protein